MKVSELIKMLKDYPQDAEMSIAFNPCKNTDNSFDVTCNIEVIGDQETAPDIIITPIDKPSVDFETLEELLSEDPNKIVIEINKDGIYIESDDELRREIDFKESGQSLDDKRDEIIKRIIREL